MKDQDRLNKLFDMARSEKPIIKSDQIESIVKSEKKVSAKKVRLGTSGRGLFNPLNLIIMISTIAIISSLIFLFSGQPVDYKKVEELGIQIYEYPEVRKREETQLRLNQDLNTEKKTEDRKKTIKRPVVPPGISRPETDSDIGAADTIIKGKVIHLSKEELSRLGFQFNEDGFFYLNKTEYGYMNFWALKDTGKVTGIEPRGFGLNEKALCPMKDATNYSFFPGMITGFYGEELQEYEPEARKLTFYSEDYTDDLLVPVYFPGRWYCDKTTSDRIIWFMAADDNFFNKLPAEKVLETKQRIDFVRKMRSAEGNSEKNFVDFDFENIENSRIKPLELSEEYIEKLGFSIVGDKIVYKYQNNQSIVSLALSMAGSSFKGIKEADSVELSRNLSFSIPMLGVTRMNGSYSVGISSEFYSNISDTIEFFSNMQDVTIPVRFVGEFLPEVAKQSVFWFYPFEGFFSSLPDSIGNPMRKEYNYNVAVNISLRGTNLKVAPVIIGVRAPDSIYKKAGEEEPIPCQYFPAFCEGLPGLDDLNIYPNPATDIVNAELTINRGKSIDYRVFDISGRLMIDDVETQEYEDAGVYRQQIDISSLEEGFYLLVLSDDEGARMTRRIIKK